MGTTRIQTRQGNAAGLKKLLEQIAASLPQQGNVTGLLDFGTDEHDTTINYFVEDLTEALANLAILRTDFDDEDETIALIDGISRTMASTLRTLRQIRNEMLAKHSA